MSDYEIERDIPLPEVGYQRIKYPFREMEVGDSIKVAIKDRAGAAASAKTIGDRYDMKFTIRKVDDEFTRIWRIK